MSKNLGPGDRVTWDTAEGETHGTVERKVTRTERAKGHVARASEDAPQYRVKSVKTDKEAIQRPEGAA